MFFLQFSREKITRKLKLESISLSLLSLKLILEKKQLWRRVVIAAVLLLNDLQDTDLPQKHQSLTAKENEIETKSADAARLEKTKSFV